MVHICILVAALFKVNKTRSKQCPKHENTPNNTLKSSLLCYINLWEYLEGVCHKINQYFAKMCERVTVSRCPS